MLLEILLVCIEHAVQPWEQLLRAMVCVKNDRDVVARGDRTDVLCPGYSPGNRRLLFAVGYALCGMLVLFARHRCVVCYLPSEVCSTALRHLQDDGSLLVSCCLECCYNRGRRGNILPMLALWVKFLCAKPLTMAGIANCFSWA